MGTSCFTRALFRKPSGLVDGRSPRSDLWPPMRPSCLIMLPQPNDRVARYQNRLPEEIDRIHSPMARMVMPRRVRQHAAHVLAFSNRLADNESRDATANAGRRADDQ
jgi:hypothetical protein